MPFRPGTRESIMLNALIMRVRGWQLARRIAKSLDACHSWSVSAPAAPIFGSQLSRGNVRIVIVPCSKCPCLRICDHLRVTDSNGSDVFVGFLGRLRIRTAARFYLIEHLDWGFEQ